MKKNLIPLMLLITALFFSVACQSVSTADSIGSNNGNKAKQPVNSAPKTDAHGHSDDAPRISLADAKKEFDAGNAVFVDTRAEASYKNERIKSSINMPMDAVEARYKELPTDKKIIAYCS